MSAIEEATPGPVAAGELTVAPGVGGSLYSPYRCTSLDFPETCPGGTDPYNQPQLECDNHSCDLGDARRAESSG